jgi:hypothetical protein
MQATLYFHSFAAKSLAKKRLATMFVVELERVIDSETDGSITFKDADTARNVADTVELRDLVYEVGA